MLLYMQHRQQHRARQSQDVWQAVERLFLPKWDKDFIRPCLWKKLPVGTRMERLGGKLCPLDSRVEDHEHVFRHCFFGAFMFDTVNRAFGLLQSPTGAVEPSRVLKAHTLLSLTMTQGVILWAGVKVQWNLRCRAKYQQQPPVLDEFIAGWATVLRQLRSEPNMSCPRADLHRFVGILDGWFEDPNMPTIFKCQPDSANQCQAPKTRLTSWHRKRQNGGSTGTRQTSTFAHWRGRVGLWSIPMARPKRFVFGCRGDMEFGS